jgi:hypothetical protein
VLITTLSPGGWIALFKQGVHGVDGNLDRSGWPETSAGEDGITHSRCDD